MGLFIVLWVLAIGIGATSASCCSGSVLTILYSVAVALPYEPLKIQEGRKGPNEVRPDPSSYLACNSTPTEHYPRGQACGTSSDACLGLSCRSTAHGTEWETWLQNNLSTALSPRFSPRSTKGARKFLEKETKRSRLN
jgi:hypothetical protein